MAKKVFRIHTGGALNEDWFSSTDINSNLIDSIATDSGDGQKLPTSIPSPFARIDLVRTAFAKVAEGNLEGLERNGLATATDNHKLISDALDIGQILFNYDKHKDDLEFIAWDRAESLDKLLAGNDEQKHLGKTLKLFLEQDRTQYNFDQFSKIYILKYKYRIIGGTSPRTLFFAAPDAEETHISFGQDVMLDDQLLPLYRRDKEFIKYLYALSKTVSNFNRDFPEFNNYLVKTVEKTRTYNSNLHTELMDLDSTKYMASLKDVLFNRNPGAPLEIIKGVPQKQFIKDPAIIETQSGFVIKTSKQIDSIKPLVLPVEPMHLRYKYTEDQWDLSTKVPAEDSRSLEARTLPDQGDKYPYLTMNDFLTDTIVKLPYEVDSNKFFTAGKDSESKKCLLPIKKEFFKYFNVEDIINKDLIEISELAGDSVEVKLSIPIKEGLITYKKIYYPKTNGATGNNNPKKGTIIEKSFALSVYPFVKTDEKKITYSVGIADVNPNKNEIIDVNFYNSSISNVLEIKNKSQRASNPILTQQSIIENQFDAIALKVGSVKNLIIPRWFEYNGNSGDSYQFAIDFGTTNSHIEYKIEGHGSEKAYDITESDEQIAFLMPTPGKDQLRSGKILEVVDGESHLIQESISKKFGEKELRKAPFRTCLLQNVNVNFSQPTNVFAEANIGFDYEKVAVRKYLKGYTDLKWASNDDSNIKRIEHYVEEMLTLCKNKVLMNNGNVNNTKITWFYPVSMTTHRLNIFKSIWQEKFDKVFNIDPDFLVNYPESIAPFYFYKAKGNINAHAKPSISIDIGGGTSDVMIFADEEPKLITSFKFAGNSIFGDGFNGNVNSNGFVQKYFDKIKDLLAQNKLMAEVSILEKIYSENSSSADLVNFFFSLINNKNIKDKQLDIDFSKMLKTDSDFKLIFLLFYSSIVYHIAEMMKIKGMDAPRNILFSGTGSKTLNILDSDRNLSSFTHLFEEIFNEVYAVNDSKITVKSDPNPKEITCKGGFHIDNDLDIKKHKNLVETSIGNLNNQLVQKRSVPDESSISFNNIDKEYRKGVVANIEAFYKLFNKLNTKLNFKDEFGVSTESLQVFNDIKSSDLEDYIMAGLSIAKNDADENEILSETLFFYPLVGKLNELAKAINEN